MSTRDQLAAYAHSAWAGWMHYLFQFGEMTPDGRFILNADKVARWQRQMTTPYESLSDLEKMSDLIEADKILAILAERDWEPASEPPQTASGSVEVIAVLRWYEYDGAMRYVVTAAAYYPDVRMWTMGADVINMPDEVLYWQPFPALPEGLE